MNKLHVVALASFAIVGSFTSACTSLLGDFEIITASATDSGAADVTAPPNDALTEAAPTIDAGADAANDYAQLKCAEAAGTKRKLGTIPLAVNDSSTPDRIWLKTFTMPNSGGRTRAVAIVPDLFNTLHAYSFDIDGGSGAVIDTPLQNMGQVLVVQRYVGGVAVLVARHVFPDGGGPGSQMLEVVKLPDDGTWSAPFAITQPGQIGGSGGQCVQRLIAALNVRDAATDDYDVVFTYQDAQFIPGPPASCAAPSSRIQAVRVRAGSALTLQSWPVPAGVTFLDFPDDAFVVGPNNALVMFNPSPGNGAPPPGLAAYIVQADPMTLAHKVALKVPLKDPQDFVLAAAMKPQPGTDAIGAAFIEANLGSATSKPTFYVGSVQPGNLTGIDPAKQLAATELAGLTDLPVDKSSYRWESWTTPQSSSHNFLAIARAFPSAAGFNFIWWDGQGRVRTQRTTTAPGGTLVRGSGVSRGASITFRQAPNVQLANLQLAWIEDVPNMPYDIWTMELICTL